MATKTTARQTMRASKRTTTTKAKPTNGNGKPMTMAKSEGAFAALRSEEQRRMRLGSLDAAGVHPDEAR
ncbi:MAG: hypothetical protein JW751_22665 [Polyangiaceae bacterium]|nr:hypothetical protein [Polyangiaceae bacterium]